MRTISHVPHCKALLRATLRQRLSLAPVGWQCDQMADAWPHDNRASALVDVSRSAVMDLKVWMVRPKFGHSEEGLLKDGTQPYRLVCQASS